MSKVCFTFEVKCSTLSDDESRAAIYTEYTSEYEDVHPVSKVCLTFEVKCSSLCKMTKVTLQ